MQRSPIITADGHAVWTMGGAQAWRSYEYRSFVVSLEWIGGHTKNPKRAMCIWPATNVLTKEHQGAWVIGQRAIGEFVGFDGNGKCTGSVSRHAIREAALALPVLGKDMRDLHALLDCIAKYATELIMMPPAPKVIRDQLKAKPIFDVTRVDVERDKVLGEWEV